MTSICRLLGADRRFRRRRGENASPGADRGVPGPTTFSLKCHSTFDGLKNTAMQPVKQSG